MKKAYYTATALGVAIASIGLLFNNCSPMHIGSETSLLSLSGCQAILANEFQRGYYPFVKANCNACHTSGPGSGFFASPTPDIAFSYFLEKGYAKISDFAVSTHKPPYTGDQHTTTINQLRASWAPVEAAYNNCKGDDLPPDVGIPDKVLVEKTANPAAGATVNLTWNTATDFINPANAYIGGSIVLTVRAVDTNGVTAYQYENLRFINAGAGAAYIKSLVVYVNNVLVDGESFLYTERYVPNVAGNNSRRLAPAAAFFASPIGSQIKVKLAVAVLSRSDIDFRPVTYAALTAPGGIFATNCQSCHGASGGVSLAANNYNNVVGRTGASDKTLVSPYSLMDNFLYERMNNVTSPMPPAGLLPQADRDRVRDWILDGAPLNDAAIAR